MARSNSAKIVRAVMTLTGTGTALFNDRIKGGRSIKVWGWKRAQYDQAVQALEDRGIKSRLVVTPDGGSPWRRGRCLRIHTQEG